MIKIHYNKDGWVCERYPYDLKIDNENRFIEVNEKQYNNTLSCDIHKAWKVVNKKLIVDVYEETPQSELLYFELEEIQQWFIDNDWIPNKIITGEWTTDDPRWIEYLSERQIKRNRQDEINKLLEIE
jgi:hypothetical protein